MSIGLPPPIPNDGNTMNATKANSAAMIVCTHTALLGTLFLLTRAIAAGSF